MWAIDFLRKVYQEDRLLQLSTKPLKDAKKAKQGEAESSDDEGSVCLVDEEFVKLSKIDKKTHRKEMEIERMDELLNRFLRNNGACDATSKGHKSIWNRLKEIMQESAKDGKIQWPPKVLDFQTLFQRGSGKNNSPIKGQTRAKFW